MRYFATLIYLRSLLCMHPRKLSVSSSLIAADASQWRSMTSEREVDLTYFLFERKPLSLIAFVNILCEWKKGTEKHSVLDVRYTISSVCNNNITILLPLYPNMYVRSSECSYNMVISDVMWKLISCSYLYDKYTLSLKLCFLAISGNMKPACAPITLIPLLWPGED